MFFRFRRRINLLSVEDSFAHLKNVTDDGDLQFEFRYRVRQLDVVQQEALTVRASIITRTIERKPIIDTSHRGRYNEAGIVRNILRLSQRSKLNVKERESYVVGSRNSDITAKINNEILPQLRAGIPRHLIRPLVRNRLRLRAVQDLRDKNEMRPVLQRVAHSSVSNVDTETSSSISFRPRQMIYDMITRQGVDPSNVIDLTHRSISARNAYGGILRRSKASERAYDPQVRLLHHYVFKHTAFPYRTTTRNFQDNVKVHVADVDSSDELEVPLEMTIPAQARRVRGRLDFTHYQVKFELIDSRTGVVVDVVYKPLDVARHLKVYYTPRKPPTVSAVASQFNSQVNIEVRQRDPGANSIQLYKKVIPRANVEINDYVLIGTYPLSTKERVINVRVDQPRFSTAIYRVVPVGEQGSQGYDFANVVVKPGRYQPVKSLALIASSVETGVEIEVRSLPPDAVSIEILGRNLSTHEQKYTNVGQITFIDEVTRELDSFSVIDGDVNDYRVYEYVARVVYKGGTSELAASAIIEHITPEPGKVDIRIENIQVDNDATNPNVTFTVNSVVLDDDLDIIRTLLERAGIDKYFDSDILREREFLKGLIAHNIQRVNLTTGEREDFGTVTDEIFSDADLRSNNAVSPLQLGNKYRYEVATLIRAPETLFEKFEKEKTDPITKKAYRFSPSKFLHPVALREGTLVTSQGLKTRYTKDALSHGKLGTTEFVEVSLDGEPASVVDFQAARFDKRLNVLTWKVQGAIEQVDHFLLMKDVHGVRTVIGKAHSEFTFGNAQYLHEVGEQDSGEFVYVVIPVFNDYELGDEVTSNAVIIE